MNIVAEWYPGMESLHNKADAQRCAEEIMSICDSPTPEQIYEKAKGEETELHKCLEWDDAVAADKYRVQQCGEIVRHLIIKRLDQTEDAPQEKIRFFFHDTTTGGYTPTIRIVREEDKYQALLQQAMSELRAFKQKYACLTELKEILALIQ